MKTKAPKIKTAAIHIMNEVIVLKKMIKTAVSVFLCMLIALTTVFGVFASGVTYPQGVTEQAAADSVKKTDLLIKNVLSAMQNTTLKKLVLPELFSDETLSGMLTGIYASIEEQESVGRLGIDASTAAVAKGLSDYPQVQKAVGAAADWENVKLKNVKWGVKDKQGFARAVSAMLTPFNDALYMVLCGGTYQAGIIRLRGDMGYKNGVIPMLLALGCTELTANEEFVSEAAENESSMVINIVLSVMSMLESVLDAPADRLTDIMPNLAYYIKYGGLQSSVDALMSPLSLGIGKYVSLFSGSQMLSVLMFIQDSEKYTTDFSENINSIISDAASPSGLKFAEINLEQIASCGTVSGDRVIANKGEAFVVLFRWLIETAKLNQDQLASAFPAGDDGLDLSGMMKGVFARGTDEIISILVGLFADKA